MNPREKQVVVVTEETYAPEVDKNCNALGDQLCLLPQGNHVGHGCILEVAWQLQTLADMHCIPRGPGGVGMALDHSQGLIEVRALSDGGAHPQHHRGLWHDGGNVPGVPVQRVGTVGVAIAGIGPDYLRVSIRQQQAFLHFARSWDQPCTPTSGIHHGLHHKYARLREQLKCLRMALGCSQVSGWQMASVVGMDHMNGDKIVYG